MNPPEERKPEDDPLAAAVHQPAEGTTDRSAELTDALQKLDAALREAGVPPSAPGWWEDELKKAVGTDEDGKRTFALRFYMRNKREELGLSMRQAAKQSGISDARWRQLEAGYQLVSGEKMPVKTTEETVLKIASGLNMNPDTALFAADLMDRHVRVAESDVWPLPRHTTIKRNPATGQPEVVKDSHVTNVTLKKATARLRQLERLYEQVARLPVKDLESLADFVRNLLEEAYEAEESLDDRENS